MNFPFKNELPLIVQKRIITFLDNVTFDTVSKMKEFSYIFNEYPHSENIYEDYLKTNYPNYVFYKEEEEAHIGWKDFYNRFMTLFVIVFRFDRSNQRILVDNFSKLTDDLVANNLLFELKIVHKITQKLYVSIEHGVNKAAARGYIRMLEYCNKSNFMLVPNVDGLILAGCNGHFDTIKYCFEKTKPLPITSNILSIFATFSSNFTYSEVCYRIVDKIIELKANENNNLQVEKLKEILKYLQTNKIVVNVNPKYNLI